MGDVHQQAGDNSTQIGVVYGNVYIGSAASAPKSSGFRRYLRMLAVLPAPVAGSKVDDPAPPPLDLWAEWRGLENAIQIAWDSTRNQGAPWAVVRLNPPTGDALTDALSAGDKDTSYQVVHFRGHADRSGILLEDEFGRADPLSFEDLTCLFQDHPVKLVFFNSSQTREFARNLQEAAGVPAVIGMDGSLNPEETSIFITHFYAGMARGKSVSAAFNEAIKKLRQAYSKNDIAIPPEQSPKPEIYIRERLAIPVVFGDAELDLPARDECADSPLVTLSEPPTRGIEMRLADGFVGRGAELVQIAQIMQARSASVIAISGLGGIGKSALATMAIFRQSWRFKAVVMISARNRPMLGPDEIVPLLDGALSLKGSIYTLPNQAERLLEAIEALNKNRVLVVLDNFDDLTESAAREWVSFLSDLDPRQGSICLITLRPAVRPPLTDLAGLGHLPLERLGEPDALRLIADRITAGDLWKKVIASEPESIKERQRILDLAEAAYLPALPPNILISLENLSDKAGQHPFALRLAVGDLAYPHVDWVKALSNVSDLRGKDWESKGQAMIGKMVADLLLAAPETANLLQAIMVFHNGATYEALKSVADPEVDSTTFDDKLKWVINSSLLESLGTNRYSLHPLTLNYLIKSYPSSSPSQAEFRKKHAGYFIDWADEHRSDFGLLEAELPNLRASFDFVTENATRNDELVWRLAFACFDMLQTHGYLKEALTFMTEAAKACEKLEYKDKLGYVYNFLGTILINLSRIDESSEFLQKAELIFQETKNQNGLASTWSNIGIIHFRRSEYNLALGYYNRAALVLEETGDRQMLVTVYNNIGLTHYSRGEYDLALEYYNRAAPVLEEIGDRKTLATVYNNIGLIHYSRSEYDLALDYFNRAAPVLEEIGDRKELVSVYNNIGLIRYSRSEYDLALEYYNKAAPVLEEIGDRQSLATVYNNIGTIHYARSEYDQALEYLNKAAPVLEEIGNRQSLATIYNNIGTIHYARSEYDQALEYLNKAAPVLEEIGDRKTLATVYNNIGMIHYSRSKNDLALEYFNRAAPVLEEIGDRQMLATVYNNIGLIHYSRSEYDLALEYFNRAATVLEEIGDQQVLATVYNNIGGIYLARSEYEQALEYFNRAAPVLEEIGDRQMLAKVYNNIGMIHDNRSEYDLGLEYYNRAAPMLEEIGDRKNLATVYKNIGFIHSSRSEYDLALEYYNRAVFILKAIGDQIELVLTERIIEQIKQTKDDQSKREASLEENKLELKKDKDSP